MGTKKKIQTSRFKNSIENVRNLETLFKYEAHKMCQGGIIKEPFASKFIILKCNIQEICKRTVEIYQWLLDFVSNEYMTQAMRDKNCLRGATYIEICS